MGTKPCLQRYQKAEYLLVVMFCLVRQGVLICLLRLACPKKGRDFTEKNIYTLQQLVTLMWTQFSIVMAKMIW